MDTPGNDKLISRIRGHRLATSFALLATLSAGIVAGSVMTRTVSGKEQTVDSSDARPLTIPKPLDLVQWVCQDRQGRRAGGCKHQHRVAT